MFLFFPSRCQLHSTWHLIARSERTTDLHADFERFCKESLAPKKGTSGNDRSHYIQMGYTATITDKVWKNMQKFEPKNKETMKGKGQEVKGIGNDHQNDLLIVNIMEIGRAPCRFIK